MNKSLEFKTFVSNYVPELGYLTDEEIEFLPIDHPLAEVAAQKILDYEENEYLPGYIEVTYGHQSILSKQNETDDLLETWGDLSNFVINQAADHKYLITLIGYPIEVFLLKKDGQFYFEINEGNKLTSISPSFPVEELMDSIVIGYRNFIDFVKKTA